MTSTELLVDTVSRIREVVHRVVEASPPTSWPSVSTRASSIAWLVWHLPRIQGDYLTDAASLPGVDLA